MGRPNQISNSGGPDQANGIALNTIKSRAFQKADDDSTHSKQRVFGKKRIYQLGVDIPDVNQATEASEESGS